MKALVAKAPGTTEYVEKPIPQIGDDDVLIKVYRNGVCGTDIEILNGSAFFMNDGTTDYPIQFGHEFSGTVAAFGKNVTGYNVGDHVVGDGIIFCHECDECKAGNFFSCKNLGSLGTLRGYPGSYAEYISLPAQNLFHIPDGVGFDTSALVEPAAIGMAGINKCNIVPGESVVLITGVGAIGLACAAFAKWRGAKTVIVSGRTPYKLDIAKKMGADVVINPKERDLAETVNRVTNGHGADCILECSGNMDVMDDCFKVLAQRGVLAIVAFYGKKYTSFDVDTFVLRDADVRAVTLHAFADTIRAISDGVDLSPLVTRHVRFDEAGQFLEELVKQKTNDIKIVVDFE